MVSLNSYKYTVWLKPNETNWVQDPHSCDHLSYELMEWLYGKDSNRVGNLWWSPPHVRYNHSNCILFKFELECDAILFKLTWG